MNPEEWQIIEWIESIPFIQRKLLGIKKYTRKQKQEYPVGFGSTQVNLEHKELEVETGVIKLAEYLEKVKPKKEAKRRLRR
jgi:hypothetical protein